MLTSVVSKIIINSTSLPSVVTSHIKRFEEFKELMNSMYLVFMYFLINTSYVGIFNINNKMSIQILCLLMYLYYTTLVNLNNIILMLYV